MTAPTVGVVVVNHDGGDLTLASLRSIVDSEWPADRLRVVLVDNASRDDVVARVRAELPAVTVIESHHNRGFAGGCNLGIDAAGDADHVALVNNDAVVDPGWLRPLVDALAADPGLGAACPKILFAGRFVDVELDGPTETRGRGDRRDLGVRLSGARVDGRDVWGRIQLVTGFWGREPRDGPHPDDAPAGEWTTGHALVRVPVDADTVPTVALRLASAHPVTVHLVAGGDATAHEVGTEPGWFEVTATGPAREIVNNAGTELRPDGYGVDRGYLEPDTGQLDTPGEVFAWCGAGVLLRREYLDDIGLFDERLFLYYEDLDLSWRGAERGWRYAYVPDSVVRHVHAASSGEGSPLKDHYNERNRLLVLGRHAPGRLPGAAARYLLTTASYARRDVASRVLRGERPSGAIVGRRVRAFGGFLRRWPGIVATRRRERPPHVEPG